GISETRIDDDIKTQRYKYLIGTKDNARSSDQPNRGGNSRYSIVRGVEESLTRLQTDYIDLLQLHYPDAKTPAEETMRALDDVVHQGKVRYIGCSNFPAWMISDANWTAKTLGLDQFVGVQPHNN